MNATGYARPKFREDDRYNSADHPVVGVSPPAAIRASDLFSGEWVAHPARLERAACGFEVGQGQTAISCNCLI